MIASQITNRNSVGPTQLEMHASSSAAPQAWHAHQEAGHSCGHVTCAWSLHHPHCHAAQRCRSLCQSPVKWCGRRVPVVPHATTIWLRTCAKLANTTVALTLLSPTWPHALPKCAQRTHALRSCGSWHPIVLRRSHARSRRSLSPADAMDCASVQQICRQCYWPS